MFKKKKYRLNTKKEGGIIKIFIETKRNVKSEYVVHYYTYQTRNEHPRFLYSCKFDCIKF